MNVLILGVDHEIQKVAAWRPEAMKAEYRGLLTRLIAEQNVKLICEEAGPDVETVGKQLTDALRLPYPWKNINMTDEVRQTLGIYEEQKERVPDLRTGTVRTHLAKEGYYRDLKNGWFEFLPRVPSDSAKEAYMFEQVMEGARRARSVMVLCGTLHVDELAERFRQRVDNVRTDALHNYDWYDSS